jgi:hypothetical protein
LHHGWVDERHLARDKYGSVAIWYDLPLQGIHQAIVVE